jgi:hypothetical protein
MFQDELEREEFFRLKKVQVRPQSYVQLIFLFDFLSVGIHGTANLSMSLPNITLIIATLKS